MTVVEQSEICHLWRTHRRNTSELRKYRRPQHALGNICVAGRTRGYNKSLPNGPTCHTPQFPYPLAPRAPLAPRLHPIPYTRIAIWNGTSNHTTSSIYAGTTTVKKKVDYENLQQHGPYRHRWLAHNITPFTNSKQTITHTQTPKHTTASPHPLYSLQSPSSIATLPASGEPQVAASLAADEDEGYLLLHLPEEGHDLARLF
jgi:hypothetical protein